MNCSFCGSRFEVDRAQRNWQHVKYCSDSCRKGVAAAACRQSYIPRDASQRNCIRCGKTFLKHGKQKYCSKECSTEVKRERSKRPVRTIKCVYCGEEFNSPRFSGKTKHCSDKCKYRDARIRHGDPRTPAAYQKEFRALRPIILKRDKCCVLCGSDERLYIHHLDSKGSQHKEWNNSEDNLVALCQICHTDIHSVTLVKIDGKWAVKGKIFDLVDHEGPLPIIR